MYDLNKIKYTTNLDLKQKLLDTGELEIIEGNTWNDTYWGQCPIGYGLNNLGKILMLIRSEIKNEILS